MKFSLNKARGLHERPLETDTLQRWRDASIRTSSGNAAVASEARDEDAAEVRNQQTFSLGNQQVVDDDDLGSYRLFDDFQFNADSEEFEEYVSAPYVSGSKPSVQRPAAAPTRPLKNEPVSRNAPANGSTLGNQTKQTPVANTAAQQLPPTQPAGAQNWQPITNAVESLRAVASPKAAARPSAAAATPSAATTVTPLRAAVSQVTATSSSLSNPPPMADDLRRRFGSNIKSALGPGTMIEGRFSFDSPVQIDGSLAGEVISTSALIVGEHATVEARVRVGTLVVFGQVNGDVDAAELVEIRAGGSLNGDIVTDRIVIEEGGFFKGQCSHHQD